jgi:hypothetical protein
MNSMLLSINSFKLTSTTANSYLTIIMSNDIKTAYVIIY